MARSATLATAFVTLTAAVAALALYLTRSDTHDDELPTPHHQKGSPLHAKRAAAADAPNATAGAGAPAATTAPEANAVAKPDAPAVATPDAPPFSPPPPTNSEPPTPAATLTPPAATPPLSGIFREAVLSTASDGASVAAAASPEQSEQDQVPSAADPLVSALSSRFILTLPAELLSLASPRRRTRRAEKKKHQTQPTLSAWAQSFSAAMEHLGALGEAEGDVEVQREQAQRELARALKATRAPGVPKDALATTLRGMGFALAERSDYDHSLVMYERALVEALKAGGSPESTIGCRRDVAAVQCELGRHAEAEPQWREAVSAQEALIERLGPTHGTDALEQLKLSLAETLRNLRKFDEAQRLAGSVLADRSARLGANEPLVLAAEYELARHKRAKVMGEALADMAPTEETVSSETPGGADGVCPSAPQTTEAARAASALAHAQVANHDECFMKALEQLLAAEDHGRVVEVLVSISETAKVMQDYLESVHLLELAASRMRAAQSTSTLEHAEILNSLGESLIELGLLRRASTAFAEAKRAIVSSSKGKDVASIAYTQSNEAKLLHAAGDDAAAAALFEQACSSLASMCATAPEAGLAQDGVDGPTIVTYMIHASILKAYGDFEVATGAEERGGARLQEAKQLSETWGF